ncbi:uncharacterized protein LOC106643508 [Copidosoma floridanum]|uniref:uncharacterized protein LOC106643508 n=1 Tax=Copidosoma floridanum TaxID=29053 RepID=UPI0006C97F46|nr:uncharacterized protein LOC106643508 [Copidosoma floridanum]
MPPVFIKITSILVASRNKIKLHGELTTGTLANQGIEWYFIRPRVSYFGNLSEAGVKQHPTYEEFSTVLVSMEMVLNSQPSVFLSGKVDDFEGLTPVYFIAQF